MEKYEEEWKKLLQEVESNLTTKIEEVRTDLSNSISTLKTEKDTLAGELKTSKVQLKVCQLQIKEMTGVIIRQDHELNECKDNIENLRIRLDDDVLKISGLIERKGEKCKSVVAEFFKNVMQIKGEIPLKDAFRIGKGDDRQMKILLVNPRDKGRIYSKAKNLKDITNTNDKNYFLNDQLTAKKKAEKDRSRQLLAANKNMNVNDQLDMEFKKGTLMVEGQVYTKSIKPPSC